LDELTQQINIIFGAIISRVWQGIDGFGGRLPPFTSMATAANLSEDLKKGTI